MEGISLEILRRVGLQGWGWSYISPMEKQHQVVGGFENQSVWHVSVGSRS